MVINTVIHSKEFNQGVYAIRWRYHVDEYGTYWYNFNDVVEILALKWKIASKLYDEFLYDNEKIIFEDSNNNSNELYCTTETKFISSSGFDRLLDHENERHNRVRDAKLRLEFENYDGKLSEDVCNLYKLVNQPLKDHKEIIKSIDNLYYSDYRQSAIDNCNDDVVYKNDDLKNMLIKAYDEDRLIDFTIEEEEEEDEERSFNLKKRKIEYKRKRTTQESTCPSWLKNIVK